MNYVGREVEFWDEAEASDGRPDWPAIRLLYEAGDVSVREISRRHGVSDTAIHKRAKTEDWSRARGLQAPGTPGLHPTANQPNAPVQTEVQASHSEPEGFSWEPENEDVIVPEQPGLAIYRNAWGQIVIRQPVLMEEDTFVRFNIESLPQVIAKLQSILREVAP
jgi:hypothetical protein